ncbi:hypothetical protein [Shewanella surugensis]|uniref:Uncharacterized protein n=1 Tax=Shewanella surugensis TaxID=212020 RepID=A0ABT0LFH5_9GAMM|nr:hypothetical protein [Shewanella surugensis]MCL1126225.1 hypothetical protein [Shewanella surugensis]
MSSYYTSVSDFTHLAECPKVLPRISILQVRSKGHEAAVERTEDVQALQDFYTSLTSSHKFNVSQHVLA